MLQVLCFPFWSSSPGLLYSVHILKSASNLLAAFTFIIHSISVNSHIIRIIAILYKPHMREFCNQKWHDSKHFLFGVDITTMLFLFSLHWLTPFWNLFHQSSPRMLNINLHSCSSIQMLYLNVFC